MIKPVFVLIALVFITSCKNHKPNTSFFEKLAQHCGNTYYGKTVFPDDPSDAFAGKVLKMHIKECTATEIRVPFQVGQDTSRTWIISQTTKGLLLKHDHRHSDGTADEITMYGGYADQLSSTANTASFAADQHTAELIPEAQTNVWSLSFDDDQKTFSYYLERHSKPRYKAIFQVK